MNGDRNKAAVELTASLFDQATPASERERKLAEMNIETYLTVKDHDLLFKKIDDRIDKQDKGMADLPCHNGGCPNDKDIPSEALNIGPFHLYFKGKSNMGSALAIILIAIVISAVIAIIYCGVRFGIK